MSGELSFHDFMGYVTSGNGADAQLCLRDGVVGAEGERSVVGLVSTNNNSLLFIATFWIINYNNVI